MNLEQLIYKAKSGCQLAEDKLFIHLYERYYLYCVRQVKNEQDAEERLMDGIQMFLKQLPDFIYKSDNQVYGCMYKIVWCQCKIQQRKVRIFKIKGEPTEMDAVLYESTFNRLSGKEIHELIRKLPETSGLVFSMYEIEGYSHKEIANELGIKESTSRNHLSDAKAHLQRLIMFSNNGHELQRSR